MLAVAGLNLWSNFFEYFAQSLALNFWLFLLNYQNILLLNNIVVAVSLFNSFIVATHVSVTNNCF
jgi:hypothetical protein